MRDSVTRAQEKGKRVMPTYVLEIPYTSMRNGFVLCEEEI